MRTWVLILIHDQNMYFYLCVDWSLGWMRPFTFLLAVWISTLLTCNIADCLSHLYLVGSLICIIYAQMPDRAALLASSSIYHVKDISPVCLACLTDVKDLCVGLYITLGEKLQIVLS